MGEISLNFKQSRKAEGKIRFIDLIGGGKSMKGELP